MRLHWSVAVAFLALAACSAGASDPPQAQAKAPPAAASDQPSGWKAVLIAGDNQEPAFDNAVDAMADKLASFGLPRGDINVLRASGPDFQVSNAVNIRNTFAALEPRPNQGCFVFVTSHGGRGRGLVLKRANAFLTPAELNQLLDHACSNRPTVVIASGCYSGIFADQPPLPAANRTILTAARPDRPSFGCNAGLKYTIFDRCVLDSLERGLAWRAVMDKTRACVAQNEAAMRVNAPSEPQLSVGAQEKSLRVFSP